MSFRKFAIWTAGAVLLSGSLLCAQPNCSLDMLTGTYAIRGEATTLVPVPGSTQPLPLPFVWIGSVSIDYSGRASGKLTGTLAGDPFEGAVTASIEVASDCTGVLHYTLQMPGQAAQGTNRIVIMDNGNEVLTMAAEMTGAQGYGGETWKRISTLPGDNFTGLTPCTADMLNGTYAFRYDGNLFMTAAGATQPVAVPFYMIGVSCGDNTGRNRGKFVGNAGGTTSPGAWSTDPSPWKVNADCTGSIKWSLTGQGAPTGEGMDKFVIVDSGNEIWSVTTTGAIGKPSIIGIYKRVSNQPVQ